MFKSFLITLVIGIFSLNLNTAYSQDRYWVVQKVSGNKWVRGPQNRLEYCIAPGNRYRVTWDHGAGQRNVSSRVVTAGSDWSRNGRAAACMGRCGANCWGHPTPSRGYLGDCLTHDVCSAVHKAAGGPRDRNCGDEWNNAVDDTIAATLNVCKYTRGDHWRASRGQFGRGFGK